MLQTLKRYQRYKKPFYGMNKGTFGFLMNKFKIKNIKKNISKAEIETGLAFEINFIIFFVLNLFIKKPNEPLFIP